MRTTALHLPNTPGTSIIFYFLAGFDNPDSGVFPYSLFYKLREYVLVIRSSKYASMQYETFTVTRLGIDALV